MKETLELRCIGINKVTILTEKKDTLTFKEVVTIRTNGNVVTIGFYKNNDYHETTVNAKKVFIKGGLI